MATKLPAFTLDVLVPVNAAFSRLMIRSKVSPADVFALFLLRNSGAAIGERRALPKSEFLQSLAIGMNYSQTSGAASTALKKLKRRGFVKQESLEHSLWGLHFPGLPDEDAVFIERSGFQKLDDLANGVDEATGEFMDQQTQELTNSLQGLLVEALKHESVLADVIRVFSHPVRRKGPQNAGTSGAQAPPKETTTLDADAPPAPKEPQSEGADKPPAGQAQRPA